MVKVLVQERAHGREEILEFSRVPAVGEQLKLDQGDSLCVVKAVRHIPLPAEYAAEVDVTRVPVARAGLPPQYGEMSFGS